MSYYTAGKPTPWFVEGLGYITEEQKNEIEKQNQKIWKTFEETSDFEVLNDIKFILKK
jgi:hypothetical protein